jgi:hypothetical protein
MPKNGAIASRVAAAEESAPPRERRIALAVIAVSGLGFIALQPLWRKPRSSVLDVSLLVAMPAWLIDVALHAGRVASTGETLSQRRSRPRDSRGASGGRRISRAVNCA